MSSKLEKWDLTTSKYCPTCGTRVPFNARFCDQCGTPLQGQSPFSSHPQTVPVTPMANENLYPQPLTQPRPYQAQPRFEYRIKPTRIVSQSLGIFFNNFLKIFSSVILFYISSRMIILGLSFLELNLYEAIFGGIPDIFVMLASLTFSDNLIIYLSISMLFLFLTLSVEMIITGVAGSMIVQSIADAYAGNPVDIRKSIQVARQRLTKVILGSIISSIGIGIGLVFFLIPGIYLSIIWAIWLPIVILGNQEPGDALRTSSQLTKNNRLRIFVVMFLLALIGFLLETALDLFVPVSFDWIYTGIYGAFLGSVFDAIIYPLTIISGTLIYLTIKSQREKMVYQ